MSDELDSLFQGQLQLAQNNATFQGAGLPEGFVRQLCFYILEGKGYQQALDTSAGFFYQSRYSKGELEGHRKRIQGCIQNLLIHGSCAENKDASPINFYPSLRQEILGNSIGETTPFFIKTENVKSMVFLLEEFLVLLEALQFHTRTDFDDKIMRGAPLPISPDFDIKSKFIGRSLDEILDYDFFEACQKNQIPVNNLEQESIMRSNLLNLWIYPLRRMIDHHKRILTEKQKEKLKIFNYRVTQASKYIANSKNVPNTETIIK